MNRTQINRIEQISTNLISVNRLDQRLSAFYFFFLFACFLFVYGCSSSLTSLYNFDYPLSKTFTKSISGNLNVQIPQGWFAAEDNENNTTDLWLVKDDYSATIKFVAVSLDDETTKNFSDEGLTKVVELNKVLVKSKFGKSFKGFTNEEQFGGSPVFSAYQYFDENNQPVRTVVFKVNSQFYESTAFAIKSANPSEIFKAQNSVLASIK